MEFVYPISHSRFSVLTIGDFGCCPTALEMEAVRDWCNANKEKWPDNFQECPFHKVFTLSLDIFPEANPNQEYVLWVDYGNLDNDSEDMWESLLDDAKGDNNFILFVSYKLTVKRLSKNLLPFI